jgi:hypothetical protein
MAVLDFPQNPALDDEYISDTGITYKFNGYAWEVVAASEPVIKDLEARLAAVEASMAELLPWTKL